MHNSANAIVVGYSHGGLSRVCACVGIFNIFLTCTYCRMTQSLLQRVRLAGRRIFLNRHDDNDDDDDEEGQDPRMNSHLDEEERDEDESSADGDDHPAVHSDDDDTEVTDDDSSNGNEADVDHAGASITEWNDDELPELIRISSPHHESHEFRGSATDADAGNTNALAVEAGDDSGSGRCRELYAVGHHDDVGSPARKNPRCSTSPAHRSFPAAFDQTMLVDGSHDDVGHSQPVEAFCETRQLSSRDHDGTDGSMDVAHMTISASAEDLENESADDSSNGCSA